MFSRIQPSSVQNLTLSLEFNRMVGSRRALLIWSGRYMKMILSRWSIGNSVNLATIHHESNTRKAPILSRFAGSGQHIVCASHYQNVFVRRANLAECKICSPNKNKNSEVSEDLLSEQKQKQRSQHLILPVSASVFRICFCLHCTWWCRRPIRQDLTMFSPLWLGGIPPS